MTRRVRISPRGGTPGCSTAGARQGATRRRWATRWMSGIDDRFGRRDLGSRGQPLGEPNCPRNAPSIGEGVPHVVSYSNDDMR